jgi:hypothetical protein
MFVALKVGRWVRDIVQNEEQKWKATFTRLGVLIAVQGLKGNGGVINYELGDNGLQLHHVIQGSSLIQSGKLEAMRVIAIVGRNWKIEPKLDKVESHWKLWTIGNYHLRQLKWDPKHYV